MFLLMRKMMHKFANVKNRVLFISMLVLIVALALSMHLLEPDRFPGVFDGIWYAIVTFSTIGYGDLSPATSGGRIVAILFIIVGVGLFGTVLSKIIEIVMELKTRREEGRVEYKGKGHVVIIGWSRRARETAKNILKMEPKTEVVLVEGDLGTIPIDDEPRFIFVKGVPSREKVLRRANIEQAKSILIFAEEELIQIGKSGAYVADNNTICIAIEVELIAPKVHTVAELILEENIPKMERANSNVVIKISDSEFAKVMYQGA